MNSNELNERAALILRRLVESYIDAGKPVSSQYLAGQSEIKLSSATVRNVMNELEEAGLITSPHTSAGRMPTAQGYRVFVDSLLEVKPLTRDLMRKLRTDIEESRTTQTLVDKTSAVMARISRLAGIVLAPRRRTHTALRQLEFVKLSSRRILTILVTMQGEVHNAIIEPKREYSSSELIQAANYFNEQYAGQELSAVQKGLLERMQQLKQEMQDMMDLALLSARSVLERDNASHDDLVVHGESNLMDRPELESVEKIRRLFDAFTSKQDLLDLLERSFNAQGVQIFIGAESGHAVLQDCSVIAAPYKVEGQVMGMVGVVGPMRMPYQQVIPLVDITAHLVSGALSVPEEK